MDQCPRCGNLLKVAQIKDGKRMLKCVNPQCANCGKTVKEQLLAEVDNNENSKK